MIKLEFKLKFIVFFLSSENVSNFYLNLNNRFCLKFFVWNLK